MNTVDPERPPKPIHDNRKRPRDRPSLERERERTPIPKPKPKPRPKPPKSTAKKRKRKISSESNGDWFTIRDILDEKIDHGSILYLVDWDGTDEHGRPYEPTWEPAPNVTAIAINAWRDKKNEEASKAANAPGHDNSSPPPESTQETDPVQAPGQKRRDRRLEQRHSDSIFTESTSKTGEGISTVSHLRAPRARSTGQLTPLGRSDIGNREADELAQAKPVAKPQGAQIVVELPGPWAFDPSEFRVIVPSSQGSQASSQTTLPEHIRVSGIAARDPRVIPDSQEISCTSASEAHSSHHRPADLFVESQLSGDPAAPQGLLRDSPPAPPAPPPPPSSSGIPSHQHDPNFVGVSGFFVTPNTSTNFGVNVSANHNQGLLHVAPTGRSQEPVNESSPVFETQVQHNSDIVTATSPVTSYSTIPASFQQYASAETSQETASQHSYITNRGSTPSNSQAAQIVQPLSSHPGEATSQSESNFSVFEENKTVSGTAPGESGEQGDSQDSSQALSESNGNIRISAVSKGHELALPAAPPQELQPVIVDISNTHRSVTPTDMDRTSAAEAPLSAKEKLRRFREGHFNESSSARSASPVTVTVATAAAIAAASPLPLANSPYAAPNSGPQAETHVDSGKSSAADIPAPLISPMLPLSSEITQTPTGLSFESAQAHIGPIPSRQHMPIDPSSLVSQSAPQVEQPETLDPSALTLSIESDVEASPSIATDDGFPSAPPRSTNSDEDEMQIDYPRSLLPHVPTGPCEYLVTLPFQTSSRPQYNDIIRENEGLMNEYNASFRVYPHEKPRKDLVEKLDIMFSRLFDICDFPPFLSSLASMSPEQIAKHVIGTNAKFSFVAELFDRLRGLNSDKKILILARPGKLMDLLDHVIQSEGCHYIRSGQEVVSAVDAKHPLSVALSSTSDDKSLIPTDVDVVIAFDHTFRQELVSSMDQKPPPILLALVNITSIQHINMRIMENLQPLERKNVLMLALAKAMRYVEEPDISESLFSIAEKFARRIQMPEEDEDEFYWEPQTVPTEIFDDLYAASSQIETTQPSVQGLGPDQYPSNRKRSHMDEDSDESLRKRPKMFQPQVITSISHISDAIRNLLGDNIAQGSEKATIVVSIDKLQMMAEKFAELESKLKESRARENEFRQLSDRAQKEVTNYAASINKIQTRYMDALEERGIFEADCRTAQEQASVLGTSLDSCRAEIATLKATRTELERKLAEANDALLHSSNPDLIKMAELEKNFTTAKAEVQRLEKRLVVLQSDQDYSKNLYDRASQRATELAAENRTYEKEIQGLRRKADENIVEVNKVQSRNEVRELAQQVKEQKAIGREREVELNRVKEELKALKNGRRETRQSSVPRSPRLSSLGVMSPRNGTRGPSAMGGPSSSRGTSPQPPTALFDGPVGSGNGVQNAALFNQGPGANRFAYLRDQRF
ncbi:hypothetical protein F4825DRAFT_448655 [Nemania diffusa]|nr:hypothetical protein F4825DRAFT_448655 [Nemania diffusa]